MLDNLTITVQILRLLNVNNAFSWWDIVAEVCKLVYLYQKKKMGTEKLQASMKYLQTFGRQ